jgi:ribonuclease P protein component
VYRVSARADIDRVFQTGRRAANPHLTLLAVSNGLTHSRGGVVVTKRHGNAVRRNRAKRLCREAFRLVRSELPTGYDYIMVPRAGWELSLERLQESIRRLAGKVTVDEGLGRSQSRS